MERTGTPWMKCGATSRISTALLAAVLVLLMSCLMVFVGQTQAWATTEAPVAKPAKVADDQTNADGANAIMSTTAKASDAKATTTAMSDTKAVDAKAPTTTVTDVKVAASTQSTDVKASAAQSLTTASEELAELSVTGTNDQTEARKILALVNVERAKTTHHHTKKAKTPGAPLAWDYNLEKAALQRAAEISVYYEHERPDGSSCFDLLDEMGTGLNVYYTLGENIQIANYAVDSAKANDGWTNSKGHYANMISEYFTCMGAASFRIAGLTCWVELFGGTNCAPMQTAAVTGTQTYAVKTAKDKANLSITGGLSGTVKKNTTAPYKVVNDNLGWSYAANVPIDSSSFTWSSSNPKIATIDNAGTAKALATGSTIITAKSKTASGIAASMDAKVTIMTYKVGWQVTGGKYWYQLKDGSRYKSCAKAINGSVYVFDANGYRRTGWAQQGGNKYYCASSGVAKRGWATISGKKYYFNPTSAVMVAAAYKTISGKTYYFNKSGIMQTGWINANGKHYMNSAGVMQKGWFKSGGKWYYLNPSNNGRMVASAYKTIGGKTYYFNKSGVMQTGWVNANGWHYMNGSGVMVKSAWVGNYWLKSNGVMAKNAWVDGGKYYVGSNGVWVKNYRKTAATSGTVYWTASGKVYHKSRSCSTLSRSKSVKSGSVSAAKAAGKSSACKVCS